MAKETLFDHPPKGHVAITAYDPSVDKWRAVEVDAEGRLEVSVTAGHKYIDRGDPDAFDFDETDLTMDSSWYDLDLSGIITDSDAVLVHLRVSITDATIGANFYLRENGNTQGYNVSVLTIQNAGTYMHEDAWVTLDENLVIEYNAAVAFDAVKIVVRGWLRPAA